MPRSSIFSFNTLRLSPAGAIRLMFTAVVAVVVIALAETGLRLDPRPKALPFETTRTGTLFDHLERNAQDIDTLLIGSSQCAYNISPAQIQAVYQQHEQAIEPFNAGVPGASVRVVNQLYPLMTQSGTPEQLWIVVSPQGMMAPDKEELHANYGSAYLAGELSLPEQQLMQLHLFKYRRQLRDLRFQAYALADQSVAGDLGRRLGPYGKGWRPGQGRWDTEAQVVDIENADIPKRDYTVTPEVLRSLQRTINEAQQAGSQVTLIIPPHPPRFDRLMSNPETQWAEFRNAMQELTQQTGARLVDHHRHEAFGNDAFFDYTHLKNADAERYSRVLAEAMLALPPMTPRLASGE